MDEELQQRRERAIDAYRREAHFRGIVQHVVHAEMTKLGAFDHYQMTLDRRALDDLLTDVAAQVLQAVYERDGELAFQKDRADRMEKMALDAFAIKPPMIFVPAPNEKAPQP